MSNNDNNIEKKKFRGFHQCHRLGNRAGASPAHQCSQCADAVPLLENGQLHFYVAITRAKKHTFVLYNTNMPSVFVTEMDECEDGEQMLCPRCKKGRLKKIKDGISINGNPYRNYLCTNSVAGCKFFWQVYFDTPDDIIGKYHFQMDRYFYHPQVIAAAQFQNSTNNILTSNTGNRRTRSEIAPAAPVAPHPLYPSIPPDTNEGIDDDLPF